MNMEKDIYDDASLIKEIFVERFKRGEEQIKLEQLLEDRQLGEVYDQLVIRRTWQQFMEYENYSGKKGYMVLEAKGAADGEYDSLGGSCGSRVVIVLGRCCG